MLAIILTLLLSTNCFASDIDFVLIPKACIGVKIDEKDKVTHIMTLKDTGILSQETVYTPLTEYLEDHNCNMQYLIANHFTPYVVIGCKRK
jgi:hypothetical protein